METRLKFYRTPGGMYLEEDPEAPERFAVWLDGEILGSGETADQAIAGARVTVTAHLQQQRAKRAELEAARPVSFTDGAWSATTRDDGFSYCPTFTTEIEGVLWVIHLDREDRKISAFFIEHEDEDTQEQELEQLDIPPAWSFSEVLGALKHLCIVKALPHLPISLVGELFFAKGW